MSTESQQVTFVRDLQGPHGSQKLWKLENGNYILTSSAHHSLAPSSAMSPMDDMAWLGRAFAGEYDPGMVSETMVFEADENGKITNLGGIATFPVHESHQEALAEAGYRSENQA